MTEKINEVTRVWGPQKCHFLVFDMNFKTLDTRAKTCKTYSLNSKQLFEKVLLLYYIYHSLVFSDEGKNDEEDAIEYNEPTEEWINPFLKSVLHLIKSMGMTGIPRSFANLCTSDGHFRKVWFNSKSMQTQDILIRTVLNKIYCNILFADRQKNSRLDAIYSKLESKF